MNANLTDSNFHNTPGAAYITGYSGEPHMDQFEGVGYSRVDGIVYIPDPSYTRRTYKSERDYSNYPMVRARIQPPEYAIEIPGMPIPR